LDEWRPEKSWLSQRANLFLIARQADLSLSSHRCAVHASSAVIKTFPWMECQRLDGRAILKTTSEGKNVKKTYIKPRLRMRFGFRSGRPALNIVRLSAAQRGINSWAARRLQKLHFKKKRKAARRLTIYYICAKVMTGKNLRCFGVRSIEFAPFESIVNRQSFE
jgi:hypothetical protein